MPSLRSIVDARHPVYTANASKWQYFSDHFQGGVDYSSKPNPLARMNIPVAGKPAEGSSLYVVRHPLEDASDYYVRLYKAPFVNLCAGAVNLLAGTVGTPENVLFDVPGEFQPLMDDADRQGASFLQFMGEARKHAAVYGHDFILVDSTRAQGQIVTQADVLAQGIRPYLRLIHPPDMLTWRLDDNGAPVEILFRIQREAPGSIMNGKGDEAEQWEYRYWSTSTWKVFRESGSDLVLIDEGDNPLGFIPLAVLYHSKIRPFLGDSLLKESARYSQLATNWLSDLDQTMTLQSFSQACLLSENKPSEVGIGSSRVLHLHPEHKDGSGDVTGAADFFYRSPDSAPLQTMWDAFFKIVDLANESMSLRPEATTDKSHAESGISRAWRWHATERRLVAMATNEQECARSIFYFASRWMGMQDFPGKVVYSTSFDLSALDDSITNLLALQTAGLPPTAQKELLRSIAKKALPNLPDRIQRIIDSEIDRMGAAAPVQQLSVAPTQKGVPPPNDQTMGN